MVGSAWPQCARWGVWISPLAVNAHYTVLFSSSGYVWWRHRRFGLNAWTRDVISLIRVSEWNSWAPTTWSACFTKPSHNRTWPRTTLSFFSWPDVLGHIFAGCTTTFSTAIQKSQVRTVVVCSTHALYHPRVTCPICPVYYVTPVLFCVIFVKFLWDFTHQRFLRTFWKCSNVSVKEMHFLNHPLFNHWSKISSRVSRINKILQHDVCRGRASQNTIGQPEHVKRLMSEISPYLESVLIHGFAVPHYHQCHPSAGDPTKSGSTTRLALKSRNGLCTSRDPFLDEAKLIWKCQIHNRHVEWSSTILNTPLSSLVRHFIPPWKTVKWKHKPPPLCYFRPY